MSESSEIGSDTTTSNLNSDDVSNVDVSNSNSSGISGDDRHVKLAYSKEESYASYSADEDDPNGNGNDDESAAEDGKTMPNFIKKISPS